MTDPTNGSAGTKDMVMRQSSGLGRYAADDASDPNTSVPDAPYAALLPLSALALAAAVWMRRRRSIVLRG